MVTAETRRIGPAATSADYDHGPAAEPMPPKLVGEGAWWSRYLMPVGALVIIPVLLFVVQRAIGVAEQQIIEREAVKIAEVVAQHAIATRTAYAAAIHNEAPGFPALSGEAG